MDRIRGTPEKKEGESMNHVDKLKELYKQVNQLGDELPIEITKKLLLYGKILEIIGGIHAQALKDWKLAEATRREALASAFMYDLEGSAIERGHKAEIAAAHTRQEEALKEGEAQRWKNAYNSTIEIIQILKLQLRDMQELNKGGV